jgi:hypothetical protein
MKLQNISKEVSFKRFLLTCVHPDMALLPDGYVQTWRDALIRLSSDEDMSDKRGGPPEALVRFIFYLVE